MHHHCIAEAPRWVEAAAARFGRGAMTLGSFAALALQRWVRGPGPSSAGLVALGWQRCARRPGPSSAGNKRTSVGVNLTCGNGMLVRTLLGSVGVHLFLGNGMFGRELLRFPGEWHGLTSR